MTKNSQGSDKRVITRTSYIKISRPSTANAKGIFDVLEATLQGLGILTVSREDCAKLFGICTDGTSANIANADLKGLVEKHGCGAWLIGWN